MITIHYYFHSIIMFFGLWVFLGLCFVSVCSFCFTSLTVILVEIVGFSLYILTVHDRYFLFQFIMYIFVLFHSNLLFNGMIS